MVIIEENKYKKDCLFKLANINEAYELHNTLNPKLFDLETGKLKIEVQQKLLEIAEEFIKSIDPLTLSIADIQFVGSNAGYNYNENSDIDLHLIVNFDLNYIDDEILQSIYNDKKNKFNEKYDFKIYDIPVEVYIENINSSNATNGIYSILKGDWVRRPIPIQYDLPDYSKELEKAKKVVNQVLLSNDPKLIEDTINAIYMDRKNGLALEGEVSIGNLVFKELRNLGLIDGLKNKYCELISEKLSLNENYINESYKDTDEYKELASKLVELRKQRELVSKEFLNDKDKYPSDEEMRVICGFSKEDWKDYDKTEKRAFYDMFNPKEKDNSYEKLKELDNQIEDINSKINDIKNDEFEKEGGNIYENDLPKEFTNNSHKYFLLDTNEYHQDLLENPEYAKSKGYKNVFIAEMTPDEYMDRCAKQVWQIPEQDAYDGMENKNYVNKYADKMKAGTKFDLPYIDIKTKSQEGRHRALAAKQLGCETMPVLYLY